MYTTVFTTPRISTRKWPYWSALTGCEHGLQGPSLPNLSCFSSPKLLFRRIHAESVHCFRTLVTDVRRVRRRPHCISAAFAGTDDMFRILTACKSLLLPIVFVRAEKRLGYYSSVSYSKRLCRPLISGGLWGSLPLIHSSALCCLFMYVSSILTSIFSRVFASCHFIQQDLRLSFETLTHKCT